MRYFKTVENGVQVYTQHQLPFVRKMTVNHHFRKTCRAI